MKRISRTYYVIISSLLMMYSFMVNGQPIRRSLNANWNFHQGDTSQNTKWAKVDLPHCFNINDVDDDEPGYYRGNVWYKRKFSMSKDWPSSDWYLYFEGANQVASVYINGKLAGEHVGGYSAFRIHLNPYLDVKSTDNEVAIRVTNAYDENIPPLTADFTFFGGIYRDVYLEQFNAIHFDTDDYASEGVYVSTPIVTHERAKVDIKGSLLNRGRDKKVKAKCKIVSPEGAVVAERSIEVIAKKDVSPFEINDILIDHPALWSPEQPSRYMLAVSILDRKTNSVLDRRTFKIGFRWYTFTADKGFFLNGQSYKIWGTSRHQDFPGKGNALPNAYHQRDVQLLKNMGGNFLRIAHYPQDPTILEACDSLGILASVEIPVVNEITEGAAFTERCKEMVREMIRQDYNHPSVIMWASMNEVLLRPHFNDDKPRQEIYFSNVKKLAVTLDSLIRKEDPNRYTMMAFHGNYGLYKRLGLIDIPMVAGWNLYQGWYSSNLDGFGKFLDQHHDEYPNKPVLITEYGADGDPRIRSFNPVRFDKSVEYENVYHRSYIHDIQDRPFVSGGLIWNLADFSSETREETMSHVNNKGILDGMRRPKDTYLLYQAMLSKQPYARIASSGWKLRGGVSSGDAGFCTQPLEVYTNVTDLFTLVNNGNEVGKARPLDGVATFQVPFINGENHLVVIREDRSAADSLTIQFSLIPEKLRDSNNFSSLNVSLGDPRYFIDEKNQIVWLPEQPYFPGGWGFIGGKVFAVANGRQPFGSDKNIRGTAADPIYATQRVGLEAFRADVPDGKYKVDMHFAELSGAQAQGLVYNLNNTTEVDQQKQTRRFDVYVNDQLIGNVSTEKIQPLTAFTLTAEVEVKNTNGIVIQFRGITGEAILNAVQISAVK